jgi:hypothetical protein
MKRAKRAVSDAGVLTNATDQRGILIPLSNREIEMLSRDEVLDFQERRRQQIAERTAQAREADDYGRYERAFVEAGGDASDARAAWLAKRKSDAAEAAGRVEEAALQGSRDHVRQTL